MVSDNFPYVNRRFLKVCVDGLKVMLKLSERMMFRRVSPCALKGIEDSGIRKIYPCRIWNPTKYWKPESRFH